MKNLYDIIRRAEITLCLSDRCSLEKGITTNYIHHSYKEREAQRNVILNWLKKNDFYQYLEDKEKGLFDKKVGSLILKKQFQENKFQYEALEPLLWSLGLISRLTPYSKYALSDYHRVLCVDIPDTFDEMVKKSKLRAEADIELRNKISMLWHWRAIEGLNPMFEKNSVKEVILNIFGDEYKKPVGYILKNQKNKQDFCIFEKPVYRLSKTELQHLYKRTMWRYHAFQWIVSDESWYDVALDT